MLYPPMRAALLQGLVARCDVAISAVRSLGEILIRCHAADPESVLYAWWM